MVKLIIKQDIYGKEILGVWDSVKKCAEDNGVVSPAISQSLKTGCRCKNYVYKRAELPEEEVIELLKKHYGQA